MSTPTESSGIPSTAKVFAECRNAQGGARVGANALTGTTPQHSASSVMDTATALVYNTKTPTSADSLRLRTLAEVAELVDAQR